MRRAMDLLLGILCLTICGPLILLIAVLIKFDSPGPVLYVPQMVGHHGKVFVLFRFRTMSVATDKRYTVQTLTPVGRLIRNYSLDHLPMLFNLLFGDLTIIGPRPMEIEIVDLQDKTWQKYFIVKPGLINYAVLKMGKFWTRARNIYPNLNQELELEYLQNRSASLDLRLTLRFLWKLIMSRGNVKARGAADPDLVRQLNDHSH